jgi:RHS repeat-associated protein
VLQGTNTTESYSCDAVGNRTASLGVASYTVNSSNELTATSNAGYTYDYNGNTTSKTDSTGTTNYTWDYENRLTQVTLPGPGGTVTSEYDPFGRRIEKISPSATSIFLYDGDNLIQTVNASGSAVARYTEGLDIDEPLAMERGTTIDYYEADGLGSITSLTAASGTVAQNYTYDSSGNLTNSSGSLTNYNRYAGREFDTEIGDYYYRARYYDPGTGRFLSEDPIGFLGGTDFYIYAANNVTDNSDPFGLQSGGPWHPPTGVHTKCTEDDNCQQILGKIWMLQEMINSHTGWDQKMPRPRGGNKHADDIGALWTQLAECQQLAAEKCKGCQPKWKPVPIPVIGPILDAITDPIADALQSIANGVKNWTPPPPSSYPGPGPYPVWWWVFEY